VRVSAIPPRPAPATRASASAGHLSPAGSASATAGQGGGKILPQPPGRGGGGAGTTDAPACTAGDVRLAITTDHPAYRSGQPVAITVTLRNTSTRTCSESEDAFTPSIDALDSHGSGAVRPCPLYATAPRPLGPGLTRTWTRSWEQRATSGSSAPGPVVARGAYALRATFIAEATTSVQLTA
jgi:hypothetical protein